MHERRPVDVAEVSPVERAGENGVTLLASTLR
jgi:hypothetical protein